MKNKIIILIIILIIIFLGAFFFLTATHIEGIVYDSVTNKSISNAIVKINGINMKPINDNSLNIIIDFIKTWTLNTIF